MVHIKVLIIFTAVILFTGCDSKPNLTENKKTIIEQCITLLDKKIIFLKNNGFNESSDNLNESNPDYDEQRSHIWKKNHVYNKLTKIREIQNTLLNLDDISNKEYESLTKHYMYARPFQGECISKFEKIVESYYVKNKNEAQRNSEREAFNALLTKGTYNSMNSVISLLKMSSHSHKTKYERKFV